MKSFWKRKDNGQSTGRPGTGDVCPVGKDRLFLAVSAVIFGLAFCGTVWFVRTRMTNWLDADASSELILGRLLASENSLLSKNWYYSTELRVVNTQIFYAFFFKIFDSWHRVRLASCVCLYIVMLAAYYFACRSLKIREYFLITASLLMVPFSYGYLRYVLMLAYYIPHIAFTFFTVGLCEGYVSGEDKRKKIVYLCAGLISSILAGLGGARQVFVLYLPMAMAAGILVILGISVIDGKPVCRLRDGDWRYTIFATVSLAGAAIGYIINAKILSKIYSFKQWNTMKFVSWDFAKLAKIINGFLNSYGYTTGKVFGPALLYDIACMGWILLTIAACAYMLKNREKVEPAHYRMALFMTAAATLFALLYIFTNIIYKDRYNLPILILSIPMIAMLFKNTGLRDAIKHAAVALFVLFVVCTGCFYYKQNYKTDRTKEYRKIVTALQAEEYTRGYATFWNGNVLTELSNGAIDVWQWDEADENNIKISSVDDVYKWLQLTAHSDTHPQGKVFLLFSKDEWENTAWTARLSTEHIIYESYKFITIGYDGYDQLKEDAKEPLYTDTEQ